MAGPGAQIDGTCDARFTGVRDALAENFTAREELGAAVALIVDGVLVVDLWGGWANAARTRRWERDTLVNVFSVGKALAGLCVLALASRGQIDIEEPVSRRWKQFGAAGKEAVTVRQVLSHRAGLAALSRELPQGSLYDWDAVTGALAEQEPWWQPGAGHGYHVHTFGFLAGEIVRRTVGERIGAFLHREIAEPCGAEIGYGLDGARRARRAEYVFDSSSAARVRSGRGPAGGTADTDFTSRLRARAYLNPPGATGVGTVNTTAWQDAELPSANLHADARGIAKVYAALAGAGPRLLDDDVLDAARREHSVGEDLVLGRPSRFGLAFQLSQPERPLGTGGRGFGHFGAGGSVGFADPDAGLAFAYVMNRGGPQWQNPRNRALIDAAYAALGAAGG